MFIFNLMVADSEKQFGSHESKVQKLLKDIQERSLAGQVSLTLDDSYLSNFGLAFEDFTNIDFQRMAKMAANGHL